MVLFCAEHFEQQVFLGLDIGLPAVNRDSSQVYQRSEANIIFEVCCSHRSVWRFLLLSGRTTSSSAHVIVHVISRPEANDQPATESTLNRPVDRRPSSGYGAPQTNIRKLTSDLWWSEARNNQNIIGEVFARAFSQLEARGACRVCVLSITGECFWQQVRVLAKRG